MEYSEPKPPHGRSRLKMGTGPQPTVRRRTPPPTLRDPTPADPTLKSIHEELAAMRRDLADSSGSMPTRDPDAPMGRSNEISGAARAARKYGTPLIWVASGISAIFSLGIAWTLFVGANATDAEVATAVQHAMVEHNGGDPEKVGPHPVMVEAIKQNTATAATQAKSFDTMTRTVSAMQESQGRLGTRSTYQFEFIQWQAEVLECVRKKCKPPKKPDRLKELHSELINAQ